MVSRYVPMVSVLYSSSTNPRRFMTAALQTIRIHHGGTTNAPNASTIGYCASNIQGGH